MSAVASKNEDVAAPLLPKNGASEFDELAGYRESSIAYLIRYFPRLFLRTLQWFNKEESAFLKGPMAPVDKEIFTEDLQVVEGAVPQDLSGMFLRTGPNPQHKPAGGYHWFDGEAMVHGISFGGGKAKTYSNHWIRTKRYLAEKAAGCNLFMRFGDMKGWLGLMIMMSTSAFHFLLVPLKKNNLVNSQLGNTALQWHNGKLLALMEGGFPYLLKLCAGAIKSISSFTFGGSLEHAFTAHPKVDPKSGEMLSFLYSVGTPVEGLGTYCAFFSVTPSGKKGKTHPVDVQACQMMHDFAITEQYAIFMDHALIFDPKHMIKAKSIPFRSDTTRPSRLGLLKRAAPDEGLQWFEVDPFVCLHTGAAWEEGSKVHLITSRYDRLELNGKLDVGENPPAEPVRYTIDVAAGEVSRTRLLVGYDLDFPVLPPHLVSLPAQFTYMSGNVAGTRSGGVRMTHLTKIDNTAGEGKGLVGEIVLPKGYVGGEFSYVARAGPSSAADNAEDDGWLVGFCTREDTMTSYCLVYDAKTMSDRPVARIAMPQRVPLGFHGTWVHTEQIKMQDTESA